MEMPSNILHINKIISRLLILNILSYLEKWRSICIDVCCAITVLIFYQQGRKSTWGTTGDRPVHLFFLIHSAVRGFIFIGGDLPCQEDNRIPSSLIQRITGEFSVGPATFITSQRDLGVCKTRGGGVVGTGLQMGRCIVAGRGSKGRPRVSCLYSRQEVASFPSSPPSHSSPFYPLLSPWNEQNNLGDTFIQRPFADMIRPLAPHQSAVL